MMDEVRDTEITLGTGRLLGLFFGLVIVCAIFFGLGFSMGRSSVKSTLTMEEAPAASMPVQANAGQKGAAGTRERRAQASDCLTPGGCDESQKTAQSTAASAAPVVTSSSSAPAPEIGKGAPLVANGGAYTVQVAAVSKQEDADALVGALRKKGYSVFIAATGSDKLFHVQVGPFADMKDAEATKLKLTSDGYNPILKR
jgi:cell division septation protein DedD